MSCDQGAIELRLLQEGDFEQLYKVWTMLNARSRFLLKERYVREKSYRGIADNLGIKLESVRMTLTRARRTTLQLIEGNERAKSKDKYNQREGARQNRNSQRSMALY